MILEVILPHQMNIIGYYTLSLLNDFGNCFEARKSGSRSLIISHLGITSTRKHEYQVGYEEQ